MRPSMRGGESAERNERNNIWDMGKGEGAWRKEKDRETGADGKERRKGGGKEGKEERGKRY